MLLCFVVVFEVSISIESFVSQSFCFLDLLRGSESNWIH